MDDLGSSLILRLSVLARKNAVYHLLFPFPLQKISPHGMFSDRIKIGVARRHDAVW